MTSHWAVRYIGQPWTHQTDCAYWFCRVQREVFGRELPDVFADHRRLALSASRLMAGRDTRRAFGVVPATDPREGDACFLSQRLRPHHIGTVVDERAGIKILHALEGVGVVLSDLVTLRANGWRIAGYWTWK